MSFKTQLFINGKWCDPVLGGTFTSFNPANNKPICEVASATEEDINIAYNSARACLNSSTWGYKSTGKQRAVILRKLGEIFTERLDELAAMDSLDQGKPMREAKADIGDGINMCAHFADLAEEQDAKQDEVINNGTNGDFITTIVLEPIGVIGAITPWNYPLLMSLWKVIPMIAAGCTMVLKPSELAPLSSILLGEMCCQAGLPDGALNVVPGLGPTAGHSISNHPGFDKLSFTGSLPTAQRIMTAAAMGPRGISLELGGKSPLIVFEDSDVNAAVDWIMTGFCWGSGQVCSSTSRVLLHDNIKDAVMTRLIERTALLAIGDSLSPEMLAFEGPAMGPVVSQLQHDKIWNIIEAAKKEGHKVAYGGDKSLVAHLGDGYYVTPTIFIDPPTDSYIWTEEIFGPVLCVRSFTTEEEAVKVANDSQYGLAAAVFSADLNRCDRVAREMRAGIVWKNCCQPAFIQAPWGGVKKSGFGRELGRWGLEEFTSVKQVTGCKSDFSWGLW